MKKILDTALFATIGLLRLLGELLRHPSRRFVIWAVAAVVVLVFPVIMLIISKIDDNPNFTVSPNSTVQTATGNRSRAVAVAAALINRELEVSRWRANDPFFTPGGWLRDMPAFQLGLVGALSKVTAAMAGEKGPGYGPNGPDSDLNNAAGLLKYPGTVWKFDTRTSWLPTASAEKQYRNAQRSLDRFNDYLSAGTASFDRRPEALAAVVEAVIRDLDDCAAAIDHHLAAERYPFLDFTVAGVFYGNKGRLYAHSIVLRDLGRDFETALAERRQTENWTRLVEQLAAAAHLRPWMVWSGAPDSSFLPNHLAAQGYLTLRARMQAAEMLAGLNIRKP
ncbi:DUF2333 domain-containing protein [Paramagnetospirillum kuznetsovii]|uniref:DUF2333 domain-containing protein n=1 Tax=Paramagnetospirillum kuznetsovii TaxID=2053833 RepID=A0A364P2S4_9PROT|nr:DUF2333 family protein [Paramagnetospirillum kuznetsovii]RAU23633.1 DUF2333 domain-containing protein [Paramagnetospirillum kuznetsovii]